MPRLPRNAVLGVSLASSVAVAITLLVATPTALSVTEAHAAETKTSEKLAAVLAAQPDDIKARYAARRPAETLNFFEVRPGDVVIETLPGGGWYSGIIHPFIGSEGKLIGAYYPLGVFERFGWDKARVQSMLDRDAGWPKVVESKALAIAESVKSADASAAKTADTNGKGAAIDFYKISEMPDRLDGTVSKILFIRSLHNLHRFNADGGFLDKALAEAFRALKPGGIAGVVQHRAPENASDAWADGSNGYLKQSKVIAAFEAAGFKLVEASELNANPKDRPTEADNVWRLPPSLRGVEENSAKWQDNKSIGESDRMTLKFAKPS